ncbi:DUF485 domain-containing protein [Streptomyces armeniacus]|uniref:DUF485 domain-containing protein n=1 Tax=Streptomyces armeniacus TaxID=83291 RepID=A0A345XP32_9ACTN|nr:DUF485 domain-containing protein [Streptomyces armeniacus]
MPIDDPWHDDLASGRAEEPRPAAVSGAPAPGPTGPPGARRADGCRNDPPERGPEATAAVYLTVQRSAAFQRVRGRYRRFVLPATVAFLGWYLAYVVVATAAPGLMARPVAGVLNVGMVAGLAQFATTFLLTWAYVRHARRHRDRAALELRWETQDMTRGAAAAPVAGAAPGASTAAEDAVPEHAAPEHPAPEHAAPQDAVRERESVR